MRSYNRRVRDFTTEKTYLAGLMLQGTEIKSVAKGMIDITGAYVRVNKGKAVLYGASIAQSLHHCTPTPWFTPEQNRPIQLLLQKHELSQLEGQTIIALEVTMHNKKAKVKIAIATKAKKYDHRQRELKKIHDREHNTGGES